MCRALTLFKSYMAFKSGFFFDFAKFKFQMSEAWWKKQIDDQAKDIFFH